MELQEIICLSWSLNYFELVMGAFIGLLLTVLYNVITSYHNRRKQKTRYRDICGEYFRINENNSYIKVEAILSYLKDDLLELQVTVTENSKVAEKWEGEVKMYSLRQGIVVWQHIEGSNKSGFKRLIIDRNLDSMILLGENWDGYGTEKLEKKNIKRETKFSTKKFTINKHKQWNTK